MKQSPRLDSALRGLALSSLVGFNTGVAPAKANTQAAATEHKHDHGHKHSHQYSASGHAANTHSDFDGTMRFHCQAPGKLEALAALAFKSYPTVSSLRVQIVTSTSQISRELTPQDSVLAINP